MKNFKSFAENRMGEFISPNVKTDVDLANDGEQLCFSMLSRRADFEGVSFKDLCENIEDFFPSFQWDMIETGGGSRYFRGENYEGIEIDVNPVNENEVSILLDINEFAQKDIDEPKTDSEMEQTITETITKMRDQFTQTSKQISEFVNTIEEGETNEQGT